MAEEEQDVELVKLRLLPSNKRLVETRKALGMTQVDLATLLDITSSNLSNIETLRKNPRETLMWDICDALSKDQNFLFPQSLLDAVDAGVFSKRHAVLKQPQMLSLTEAARAGLLPTRDLEETERLVSKDLLAEQVDDVLLSLNPRERRVLQLRFGLEDGQSRTLEGVGKEFGVTREVIRQIEARALRKLRHPTRSRRLKDFLE